MELSINYFLETCTDFVVLLLSVFGDAPPKEVLSGVCIDRACDVQPYVKVLHVPGTNLNLSNLLIAHWLGRQFCLRLLQQLFTLDRRPFSRPDACGKLLA